jgi:hypothetical protein
MPKNPFITKETTDGKKYSMETEYALQILCLLCYTRKCTVAPPDPIYSSLQLIVGVRLIIIFWISSSTVQLAGDRVCDIRKFLLLFLEIFGCG